MNKKIYLLLPLCIPFLSGCNTPSVRGYYELTLRNTDKDAGTIVTKDGKYKSGEKVSIIVNTNEGYKFLYWKDTDVSQYFHDQILEFTMPARDVNLSAYYELDSYNLSVENTVVADNDCFDFAEVIERGRTLVSFYVDDRVYYGSCSQQVKYKSEVSLKFVNLSLSELSFSGFYDGDKYLGKDTATYQMPNHDAVVHAKCTSSCRAVSVTNSLKNSSCFECEYTTRLSFNDSEYNPTSYFLFGKYATPTLSVVTSKITKGYTFSHWLDLDTDEIVTTDTSFTVPATGAIHHYSMIFTQN